MKEFEKHLEKYYSELFSFSFALVADELHAKQIVIDSMHVLLIDKKDLLVEILNSEKGSTAEVYDQLLRVKKFLFKTIYSLSKRRLHQLKHLDEINSKFMPYKSLSLEQKGTLFLVHKTSFNLTQASQVLEIKRHEVINILGQARHELINRLGETFAYN
ncbi:MAG: hypothetical protein ISR65_14865 [Bacteriovoracaceae bacterium]|nr:hypothetical protein [Bacteriovoracaceae bacterium]